jgi:3-dehydro-L-gulonate 2-dehydrogenase
MADLTDTVLVSIQEMNAEFIRILLKHGFTRDKARKCAEIFAVNTLEGVHSHGINRFPRFISYVQKGYVIPDSEPSLVHQAGSVEQWNGNLGPGPLNALFAAERAMSLSDESGIGLVGMANTNHWMRGGFYGWQAAKKGYVFFGWTNTIANMPAWGATDCRLGNNPLVMAVPFSNEAIVLDFAMSQYSYGKLEALQIEGKELDYAGGYNRDGELTKIPVDILETSRVLPAGYWKGAGLSFLLDILASVLSGGDSTYEISSRKDEYGISQVFITIPVRKLQNFPAVEDKISAIVEDFRRSKPENTGNEIRYPGERIIRTRKTNIQKGIPVSVKVWAQIRDL